MLKKILLVASVFLLQGCLQEPTNEGCISDVDQLELQIQSPSKNTCLSQNKMIHELNVMDYTSDPTKKDWFTENEFINELEAKEKNARQEIHNENDLMIQEAVSDIYETILDSRVLTGAIAVVLLLFVLKGLTANFKQPLQELKIYFIPMITIALVLVFFISDNQLQKKISRALVYTADTATRVVEVALIKEIDFNKAVLSRSGDNESRGFLRNLYLMNVCLSNNQKNAIQDLNLEMNDEAFNSQKEIADYYFKKNQVLSSGQRSLSGESISVDFFTNQSGITSVRQIKFQDCGSIVFAKKDYSEELSNLMVKYNFAEKVKTAISEKSPKGGWESIRAAFEAEYPSESDKDKLLQLLVAYSYEYKKGLLVGASSLSTNKTFDASSLSSHLSGADRFYNIVNSSVCVENGLLIEKSQEDLKEYETTKTLTNIECITPNTTGLTVSNSNVYHEKNERDKIKDAIEANKLSAISYYEGQVSLLAEDLNNLSKFFEKEINDLYKPNKRLIKYINEGMISFSKFLKELNTKTNAYIPLYKEILNIVEVDIEESLQNNFTNRSEEDSTAANTSLYTVQKVSSHLPEIKEDFTGFKNNATSQMLENKYNVGDLETEDGMDVIMNNYMSGVSYVAQNAELMTCNGNTREDCEKSLVNYNGVDMWVNIMTATKLQSAQMISTGLLLKIPSVVMTNLSELQEDKYRKKVKRYYLGKNDSRYKNTIGKETLKPKRAKSAGLFKGLSLIADIMSDIFITTGMALLTVSAFMELLLEIPHFVNVYTVVMAIFLVQIMPLVLVAMGINSFHGNLNIKMHVDTVVKMFGILITPFITIINSVVAVFLGTYIYVVLLEIFPLISDWILPKEASEGSVSTILGTMFPTMDRVVSYFVDSIMLLFMIAIVFWIYLKVLKIMTTTLSRLISESGEIISKEIESSQQAVEHIKNATLLKEGWSKNRYRRMFMKTLKGNDRSSLLSRIHKKVEDRNRDAERRNRRQQEDKQGE
ncbi:MAG: hypothetical protein CL760_12000 [Chloroflexi bacterium]|nr:hypothetical protein [Chloroflexota bacterium]|tara:strand:- start:32132 stop:35107 length:2976 start_codon:yes stop_codon:yes gene_type:complete